ncbi:MAG: hypothetical protein JXR88_18285 [Clostridia bacterium]|nr:hypothetical protein [Clostridia bacterium]
MRIIKDFLEQDLRVPVEISKVSNKQFGDFSSNVLMKYQLQDVDLKCPSWIEKYEIINGHLNLFISTKIEPVVEGLSVRIYRGRIYDIYNRLTKEKYLDNTEQIIWPELIKIYNLINMTQKTYGFVSEEDVASLIHLFEQYDSGFIYRNQRREILCSIRLLLENILTLLERVVYEKHI